MTTSRISVPAATTLTISPKCVVTNAFSLQMLGSVGNHLVKVTSLTTEDARRLCEELEAVSAVGHADTAMVLGNLLNADVAHARVNVSLLPGDTLIVGQIVNGRLPEGATTLPEGATIRWMMVELIIPPRKDEVRDMQGAISAAVWGYYDHHSGVDDDEYLEDMSSQAKSACKLLQMIAI